MPKESRRPSEPRQTVADEQAVTMYRAVDVICDAWPKALEDRRAIGFPVGRGYGGSSGGQSGIRVPREDGDGWETVPATGVEIAALASSAASDWLDLAHDTVLVVLTAAWPDRAGWTLDWRPDALRPLLKTAVDRLDYRRDDVALRRLHSLANQARHHWPPPPKRGARDGGVTVGERGNDVENCGLCGDPVLGGRNDPIRRIDGQAFHAKRCWFTVTRQRQPQPQKEAS